MTSTNYFEKLAMMESTGSTLGAKGVTFADCYRSAKAFMIHPKGKKLDHIEFAKNDSGGSLLSCPFYDYDNNIAT